MQGMIGWTGTLRRRRRGSSVLSVGVFAWTLAAFQPCCEALAAAVPHEHAPERHAASLHHNQERGNQATEHAGAAHAHCVSHALSAIDPVHGFAAIEGPRSQDATDGGDVAWPADEWSVPAVLHLARPGLPPSGESGARTHLRFQRFLE